MDTEKLPRKLEPKLVFLKGALDDLGLLVYCNKPLIIFTLIVVCIAAPFTKEIRFSRVHSDHQVLYTDRELEIVEGEGRRVTNAQSGHRVSRRPLAFNGKYLSLYTDRLPPDGFISFKYSFSVDRGGVYKLFVAGSPPGSAEIEMGMNYSPYEVRVDKEPPLLVSAERKHAKLKKIFGHAFYSEYVYASGMTFTKIGGFDLAAGKHTLEFIISAPRLGTDKYFFRLDTFFLVPQNWKPQKEFLTFPDDLFSY